MPTVGIDVSQAVYGTGVSNYTIDLVKSLNEVKDHPNYKLFGGSLRQQGTLRQLFPQARIFPLPPTLTDLIWNRWHSIPIESFLGQVDVLHSSDHAQPPARARKVTTIHDLSPFLFPDEMRSGNIRDIVSTQSARMKWVVKECDIIICVSQNTANDLMRLFSVPDSKVVVIYESLPTVHQIKAQESPYKDYLVAIGTLQPRKNIRKLINAYLQFKSKLNLPEKLVIVGGSGWGDSDLPQDKSIVYTGFVSHQDLANILAGSLGFVFPSLYEGFGLPILEAFYHKVPVIASNTSSIPEVAGNAAVFVDPNSEESIAHGISTALKNRRSLIEKGTVQLQKFSWEKTAKQTVSIYESLF